MILNWNGRALLEKFLPSVIQHSAGAAIYVADNASSDDSIASLASRFPSVKIIQNSENYGFANGYNHALKHVSEEILVLLNSDVEVTSNWLSAPLQIFETMPHVAAIQPKILDYKDKTAFEYAGAGGGFIDKFGYPFCRGRIFDSLEKDYGQYNDTTEIFWASGACMFIRKSDFELNQGFDGDFFAHQEEIDLCWRLNNNNRKVFYCGASVVYHVGGATLNEGNPHKTYLNFRNSLFMLLKNLPKSQIFSVIFMRLILDGLAGVNFVFRGKISHMFAIVKAHFAFYGSAVKMYRKRRGKQASKYYRVTNIVCDYFFRGRKKYADLF